MTVYHWQEYDSSARFDIRAFPTTPYGEYSIARIYSHDNKVFKLWIPDAPGRYSTGGPVETDDNLTVEELKNLATVLLATKETT